MPEDGGAEMTEEEKQSFLDRRPCMRDRGYDFPDPTFDGGRVTRRSRGRRRATRARRTRRSSRT